MESRSRSIVKTLSWRLWATLITATLAWGLTGSMEFAAMIGLFDTTIKLLAYYLHERFWSHVSYGLPGAREAEYFQSESRGVPWHKS